MVSSQEMRARVVELLHFNKQEVGGLIAAMIVTAFIFSFRDWGGETFDITLGFVHFLQVLSIAAIIFFVRTGFQKFRSLYDGYQAEFRVWWIGLVISVVVALLTAGWVPLILMGGVVLSVMSRHRLGEFRYGFSYVQNAIVAVMGPVANMVLAVLFSIGLHYFPQSYFLTKAVHINLIMALISLLPLPQLDGLNIFWGWRGLYYFAILAALLFTVLLLSKTIMGLIVAIVLMTIGSIVVIAISSLK